MVYVPHLQFHLFHLSGACQCILYGELQQIPILGSYSGAHVGNLVVIQRVYPVEISTVFHVVVDNGARWVKTQHIGGLRIQ